MWAEVPCGALPTSSRPLDQQNRDTCWSWHLPRIEIRGGCRGFCGPVPPPLLMWCLCAGQYSNALDPHSHAQIRASRCAEPTRSQYSELTMEIDATSTSGPEDAEPPSPQTAQDQSRRARSAASD